MRNEIEVWIQRYQGQLRTMEYQPSLIEEIYKKQETCSMIQNMCQKVHQGEAPGFEIREYGILRLHGRICVPRDQELRQKIL